LDNITRPRWPAHLFADFEVLANQIEQYVRTLGTISFAELVDAAGGGARGNCSLYMRGNERILYWGRLSNTIAIAIDRLVNEGRIRLRPVCFFRYVMDGAISSLPIADPERLSRYRKTRWLPVVMTLPGPRRPLEPLECWR